MRNSNTLRLKSMLAGALVAAALSAVAPVAASAATMIDFGTPPNGGSSYSEDLFDFADSNRTSGQCRAGSCLALNDNSNTVMTYSVQPGLFTLNSFWFNFEGNGTGNTLVVTGSNGAIATYTVGATYPKKTYHFAEFSTQFENVSSIRFSSTRGGNVRIDDMMASAPEVAPVPLPAAAFLLMGGLGALGVAGRKRRTAA